MRNENISYEYKNDIPDEFQGLFIRAVCCVIRYRKIFTMWRAGKIYFSPEIRKGGMLTVG
jgi:hypothetical protein